MSTKIIFVLIQILRIFLYYLLLLLESYTTIFVLKIELKLNNLNIQKKN